MLIRSDYHNFECDLIEYARLMTFQYYSLKTMLLQADYFKNEISKNLPSFQRRIDSAILECEARLKTYYEQYGVTHMGLARLYKRLFYMIRDLEWEERF